MKKSVLYAPILTMEPSDNCFGYGNKKKWVVIHLTGNKSKGANARMHALLQKGRYSASWHWQVDDTEAIQSFPHDISCYHASDGRGEGNMNGIAIEGCINSDGDYLKMIQNLATLSASILKEEGLPISHLKQHHDFARDKKNCPQQIRDGYMGITWTIFKKMVQLELNKLSGKPTINITESKPKPITIPKGGKITMSGTFTPNDTILVRNQPSTKGTHVATYLKGEVLNYDYALIQNGYVWLHYQSLPNEKDRYIPIAPVPEVWGKF